MQRSVRDPAERCRIVVVFLGVHVRAKLDKGYPKNNIIFQAPERAVVYGGAERKD